jgi:ferredoxin
MIRVRVNQDECMSIGRCLADAPNVFRFDDNELSEVVPGQEGSLDEHRTQLPEPGDHRGARGRFARFAGLTPSGSGVSCCS